MSRLSEDHRTASEEIGTVLKWSLVLLLSIGVIGIVVFFWVDNTLHFFH